MTASYSSFQTVMMQQKQAATTQRRTPSPGEPMGSSSSGGMQGFAGDDYSPTPGADASSQSSPGSASDHMGMFSTTSTAASSSHNPPNFPGSAALAAFDAEKHPHMNRIITTTTSSNNGASQENLSAMTRKKPDATSGVVGNPTVTTVRRQKRLQRNRESARLSRRRRKQYLEELEERVDKLSEDLDLARRRHAMEAIVVMKQKRIALLNTTTPHNVNLNALETVLARTSQELMIATTFQGQQLKSFSAAPSMQFILWLSLQTDAFFRGGRAASERLSAARIGERMLSSGTDSAAPSQSMWPLLCNEIGLSYDQEEKLRTFQRTLLQDPNTWVDRHTAFASRQVMTSSHDTVQALTLRAGQRERSSTSLLSEEQRLKMMTWSVRNRDRVMHSTKNMAAPSQLRSRDISPGQHVAANLYILNEQLQQVLQVVPRAAPLVTGAALKKLSHRPSFEPLGSVDEKGDPEPSSSSSSGSLKRAASEMSMDDETNQKPQTPSIIPVEAQASAMDAVQSALAVVHDLLPPPPVIATAAAIPSSMFLSPHTSTAVPTPIPVVSLVYQAPIAYTQSAPAFGALQQAVAKHERKLSFMPAHLNVVPEEMWPADEADEFLLDMIEGDWAIGEGIDMDIME